MPGTDPYAALSAPAPSSTPTQPASPAPSADPYAALAPTPKPDPYAALFNPKRAAKTLDKTVGGAIAAGHENPFTTFLGWTEAPQRAAYAALTGQDIGKAFTHPKEREELQKAFKTKIGLQQLEEGPLAGEDLPRKVARGTLDFATDVATDPVSYLPVGKIGEAVGRGLEHVFPSIAEQAAIAPTFSAGTAAVPPTYSAAVAAVPPTYKAAARAASGFPDQVRQAFAATSNPALKEGGTVGTDSRKFIHDVWAQYQKQGGTLGINDFKKELLQAHRKGEVELDIASLGPSYHARDIAAASTPFRSEEFHFVKKPAPAAPPPPPQMIHPGSPAVPAQMTHPGSPAIPPQMTHPGSPAVPGKRGYADVVSDLTDWVERSPIGRVLDPEHELRDWNVEGKAIAGSELHKAEHASRAEIAAKEPIVRANAAAIRSGVIPSTVRALFHDPAKIPVAKADLSPKDVIAALHEDRRPITRAAFIKGVESAGMLKSPSAYTGGAAGGHLLKPGVLADQAKIADAQKALRDFGAKKTPTDNELLKVGQVLTHLGNQMFLAIPFPHGGNLSNLSYMNYGMLNTIAGLGRALEVSRGKPSAETKKYIDLLEKYGGNSQYQNIFSELGLDKLFGSEKLAQGANKVIVPAQRLSNFAQNKFLNPLESGLRAQAYKDLEKRGITGPQAIRDIDRSFGSEHPNALSRSAAELGAPFAKFHTQTAIGQGLRSLATNPARVTNVVKADVDYNQAVNPGNSPKYRTSVPSMSTARSLADPLHYFSTIAGPLGSLESNFSALSLAEKGKVAEALSVVFKRYIPIDQVQETLHELATRSKGQEGETGVQDILPSLVGGYYQKSKAGQ